MHDGYINIHELFYFIPESNRQDLVQSGAVAVFIKLLESQDIDVQFYCAAALSNIAVSGKDLIPFSF